MKSRFTEEDYFRSNIYPRLAHYFDLKEQKAVARYLRCKSIPVTFSKENSTEELWTIHKNIQDTFDQYPRYKTIPSHQKSFLDLKVELANRMLANCEFCENHCRIDRSSGERGFCGVSSQTYLSSAFLHLGEEPPLIPSGTIFFAGCSFDCVFCQNADISESGKRTTHNLSGSPISAEQLAKVATQLALKGAQNINYVGGDPTPNIHTILDSMLCQEENICQLWNSNFYNTSDALHLLIDVIDLWLPDFKYGNNCCAQELSRISNYWDVIRRNFKFIYTNGSRNIIIRHLVMPGHLECCSKPILTWIAQNIPNVIVNIMGQYHPTTRVISEKVPKIQKKITSEEMENIRNFADGLQIEYKCVS